MKHPQGFRIDPKKHADADVPSRDWYKKQKTAIA